MAIRTIQTSFSAGEISEQALSRYDMAFYNKSAEKLLNLYVNATGSIVRRDGSKMIAPTDHKRIETFLWNGLQKYCISFSNTEFRVYKDDNLVFTGAITLTDSQLQEFTITQGGDVMLIFHNEFITKRLARRADNDWALTDVQYTKVPFYAYEEIQTLTPQIDLTYPTTVGTVLLSVKTSVIPDMRGKSIFFNNGYIIGHARISSGSGSNYYSYPYDEAGYNYQRINEYSSLPEDYLLDQWYATDVGTLNFKMTVSANGYGDNSYLSFAFTSQQGSEFGFQVGDKIFLKKGGALEVVEIEPNGNVWALWQVEPPDEDLVKGGDWEVERGYEPIFSETRGYPACGVFGKGRLFLGGIRDFPNAILGSKIEDYFNFDLGTGLDDEGLLRTSPSFSPIRYMTYTNTLEVFTYDNESFLEFSTSGALTPSTFNISVSGQSGANCQPITIDGNTIFVEQSGKILRRYNYDDIKRNYQAPNISILSDHLIKNVKKMVGRASYSENPNNLVYMLNSDGTITILNTLQEQDFTAFSRCETNGTYLDIASVESDVYCLVERDVAGVKQTFLERFDNNYVLDCSIKSEEFAERQSEFSGLDIFNNQEVFVIGDDYFNAGYHTVENGKITGIAGVDGKLYDYFAIDTGFKQVEVGYGFYSELVSAGIEYTKNSGNITVGQDKRAVYAQAKIINTAEIVAKVMNNTYRVGFIKLDIDKFDNPVNIDTGYKKIYLSGITKQLNVSITQEFPGRFELSGLIIGVE